MFLPRKLLGLPLSLQEKFLLMHGSLQRRKDHLTRVVAWSLLQKPLQKLGSQLVAAVKAIAELNDADVHAPQRALLHLPHRHGGFGIQRFQEDVADASFLAAAALADNVLESSWLQYA